MKRTKIYIEAEQAKKKVDRYSYWSIKDENGITICSNTENNPDGKSFAELLDKIIADNVDAEVQIKYGANEQSSRNNPPLFITINENIEWVEPEEETININGAPHKVDRHGNVNINLPKQDPGQPEIKVENARIDTVRQEMEIRLAGIQRENELERERMGLETERRLGEQLLKFREMMLEDRENRLSIREQIMDEKEKEIAEKELETQEDLKGYLKGVPKALAGLIKDFTKEPGKSKSLGEVKEQPKPKERKRVRFSLSDQSRQAPQLQEPEQKEPEDLQDDADLLYEEEIRRIEREEQERMREADQEQEENYQEMLEDEQDEEEYEPSPEPTETTLTEN